MRIFVMKDDGDSSNCVIRAVHDIRRYCKGAPRIYFLSRSKYDYELGQALGEEGMTESYESFLNEIKELRDQKSV